MWHHFCYSMGSFIARVLFTSITIRECMTFALATNTPVTNANVIPNPNPNSYHNPNLYSYLEPKTR